MAVNKKIVEKVDKIMEETVAYITEKYGEVKPEWNGALDMLRTQYTILFECKDIVEKDGVMVMKRDSIDKHPLLKQITDSQVQIVKLIQEFGLSPKSNARIKIGGGEDTDKEYIEALISGNGID